MDRKKIRKFGNSLGLILNATLLAAVTKLSEGDSVDIEYQKDKIIIKKAVE